MGQHRAAQRTVGTPFGEAFQGVCRRLGVPAGTVRNSVGAGDSMVAGFLAGWLQDGTYDAAHRLGAAAGSATAFRDGLAGKDEILSLFHSKF